MRSAHYCRSRRRHRSPDTRPSSPLARPSPVASSTACVPSLSGAAPLRPVPNPGSLQPNPLHYQHLQNSNHLAPRIIFNCVLQTFFQIFFSALDIFSFLAARLKGHFHPMWAQYCIRRPESVPGPQRMFRAHRTQREVMQGVAGPMRH
jgi:hypothetical protein